MPASETYFVAHTAEDVLAVVKSLASEKRPFVCVWDTDTVSFSEEIVCILLRAGCIGTVSVGGKAELFHDLIDEIVVEMNIEAGTERFVDSTWLQGDCSIRAVVEKVMHGLLQETKERSEATLVVTSRKFRSIEKLCRSRLR